MPINVACHGCRAAFSVPDHFAGKSGKCKRCGTPLDIPAFVPATSPAPFIVTLDDDRDVRLRPARRKGHHSFGTIVAAVVAVSLLLLIGIVVATKGEPSVGLVQAVIVVLALPVLFLLLYPLWLPAVLARRGVLSPGRWAAASLLCFLVGGLAILFLAGSEMAERASEHPGTAEAIPVYIVSYLWAVLMQGIIGCLLAAVVHRPKG